MRALSIHRSCGMRLANLVVLSCESCGSMFTRPRCEHERNRAQGRTRDFCSLRCFGLSKRQSRTAKEKKSSKAAYDKVYRRKNLARIKANKAAYFQRTYDPVKAREVRYKNRERHRAYIAAYNADPKNKAHKREYDARLRADEYGEFAGAYRLLLKLQREIIRRSPSRYERLKARGYYDNRGAQNRRRDGQVKANRDT